MRPNQPVFILRQTKGKKVVAVDGSMANMYREIYAKNPDIELPDRKDAMKAMREGDDLKFKIDDKGFEISRIDMMDFSQLN